MLIKDFPFLIAIGGLKWRSISRSATTPQGCGEEAISVEDHAGRGNRLDQAQQEEWRVHGRKEGREED